MFMHTSHTLIVTTTSIATALEFTQDHESAIARKLCMLPATIGVSLMTLNHGGLVLVGTINLKPVKQEVNGS